MPLYTYRCPDGHEFDRIVPVAKRDDLQPCPQRVTLNENGRTPVAYTCEQLSERKGIELNAKSFPGADSWRKK